MKKIGIVTIIDYNNYGNRLQNYATQKILEDKGFVVETIRNNPKSYNDLGIKSILKSLKKRLYFLIHWKRKTKFKKFSNNKIKESSFEITRYDEKLYDELNKYDFIVVGSDQIWNPFFRNEFFLDLVVGVSVPAISLSASFGISDIPDVNRPFYREHLGNLKRISVRENSGKKIIEELTGIQAEVLIDPTMVLSVDQWSDIAKRHSKKPSGNYILVYALSESKELINNLIKEINIDGKYKIIELGNSKKKRYFDVSPSEFIDYIKDSSLVITDSYHGIVFSTIFEIPFIIFDRNEFNGVKSMNSRIETFLEHFNFECRYIDNIIWDEVFQQDFMESRIVLERKRVEFDRFLENALGEVL